MVSFAEACPYSALEGEAKFWITLYDHMFLKHVRRAWVILIVECDNEPTNILYYPKIPQKRGN